VTLAKVLANHADIDEGLRRWERHQLNEGNTMSDCLRWHLRSMDALRFCI
jgi:hypothetical protein